MVEKKEKVETATETKEVAKKAPAKKTTKKAEVKVETVKKATTKKSASKPAIIGDVAPKANIVKPVAKKEVEKKEKPVRDALGRVYSTGKRKSSIARVWIMPGKGKIIVVAFVVSVVYITIKNTSK